MRRRKFSYKKLEERKDYSSSARCFRADNNDINGLELFNTLFHNVIYEQCLLQFKISSILTLHPHVGRPQLWWAHRLAWVLPSPISYRPWARGSLVSPVAHLPHLLKCKSQDFLGSPMAKTALPVQGAGIQMPQLKIPHTTMNSQCSQINQ